MVLSILTGTFVPLLVLFSIVFMHEMGHFLVAKYFKWRITSVMIWVFGGVMKTEESANRPIKEDILVTIAGPLQHVFIYIGLMLLQQMNVLPASVLQIAFYYNAIICLFNLLPIYPLDGGKLFFYLLSLYLPFRQAHTVIILLSLLSCVCIVLLQLFVLPFTLSSFLLISFLLLENRTEWKNRYYTFIRFLVSRYGSSSKNQPTKAIYVGESMRVIDVLSLFIRNKRHTIYEKSSADKLFTDEECLSLYFEKAEHNRPIKQLHNIY